MIYYERDGKEYRAEAVDDPDPLDPREEYENLSHMLFYHPRYSLGDLDPKNGEAVLDAMRELISNSGDDIYTKEWDFQDLVDYIRENVESVYLKPVYMYDHSGITIGTVITWPDHNWDGSTIGVVYVTKDEILKNTYADEKSWLSVADDFIESEIEEYDMFLRGDCHGINIEEKKSWVSDEDPDRTLTTWEDYDSCYGFLTDKYGEDLELYMLSETVGKPESYRYEA